MLDKLFFITMKQQQHRPTANGHDRQILVLYTEECHSAPSDLCSIFFGHAFTVTVADKILEVPDERSLPLNILLSVSYDGPNVNKFIDAKLSKVPSDAELPVLIDICLVHSAHGSRYLKLEKMQKTLH